VVVSAVVAAAVAGFMGSVHCLGMCGGFAAACARPRQAIWFWHLGRLTAYALLGVVAGAVGGTLPGPTWVPAVLSLGLLAWFAAVLAGLVPETGVRIPGLVRLGAVLVRREGEGWRYLFGVATGFLPCGLVYAAVAIAVSAADPVVGGAAMLAFGAGTVPALSLLSVGLRRLLVRGIWVRRVVAVLVLAAGVWSIGMRDPERARMHMQHDSPAVQPADRE
jgi:sulfite exporter TauE/SafE